MRQLPMFQPCYSALAICGLLLGARSGPAQPARFDLETYAQIARVSDLRVAPDGARAVFVRAYPNYQSNAFESDLVLLDLQTRAMTQLTWRKNVSAPRWSPDGTQVSFAARVDGKPQLFLMSVAGGEARQLTTSATGVGNHEWNRAGTAIAYAAQTAAPAHAPFDDAFDVNGNDYLTLSAPKPNSLWQVTVADGASSVIASGTWSIPALANTIAWSADDQQVYFTQQPTAGTRDWERRTVAVVRRSDGTVREAPGAKGRACGSAWPSPDGSQVLMSCSQDGHVKNQTELTVVPVGGGTARSITAAIDRNFARGVWMRDSRAVLTAAPDGTRSGVWELPLDGTPRRRDVGAVAVSDLDVTRDGTILFIGTEAQRPPEVYRLAPGQSGPERLTDMHASVAGLSLGTIVPMTWTSKDGLPLSAVVTLPPAFDSTRRYPVLLHIHGGPWASSREAFSARSQLFASRGFVVYEPNYRGSDNHGNRVYSAVYRDHGAGPGRDIMEGLALLKKRPWVDTTRIGVSGWSYGGYMTTWLIGHYGGWKAAMAGAAVIDLIDDYNLNDLSLYIRAYGETLSFPADLKLMDEQSPMTYVDRMTTPLLLLSTTGDVRVPVTQSYRLFNALKERGRDVRLRLWPVPGHFPADPWRARDVDREWVEYFAQRLK